MHKLSLMFTPAVAVTSKMLQTINKEIISVSIEIIKRHNNNNNNSNNSNNNNNNSFSSTANVLENENFKLTGIAAYLRTKQYILIDLT